MNDITKSFATLYKNAVTEQLLNEICTTYKVFKKEYLSIKKEVDRPSDYYFLDDDITFIIKLRNTGDLNLRGFCLKDDTPSLINPLDNGYYEVITPKGDISFANNQVIIENIDLAPGEEMEILITGRVKDTNEIDTDLDEITF